MSEVRYRRYTSIQISLSSCEKRRIILEKNECSFINFMFLSVESPNSLETSHLAFRIPALHRFFIFIFIFNIVYNV